MAAERIAATGNLGDVGVLQEREQHFVGDGLQTRLLFFIGENFRAATGRAMPSCRIGHAREALFLAGGRSLFFRSRMIARCSAFLTSFL